MLGIFWEVTDDLRVLFHFGTSKALTAWICSNAGGSQSAGRGLKLIFRARVEASELLLDRFSMRRGANVSNEETRFRDMVTTLG